MVEAVRCLYMRAAIVELSKKHGKTERRYNEICQLFPAIKDNIPRHRFDIIALRIKTVMARRWHSRSRSSYLQRFSTERWKKLVQGDKAVHTPLNCAGCAKFGKWYNAFPGKSSRNKTLAQKARKAAFKMTHQITGSTEDAVKYMCTTYEKATARSLEEDMIATPNSPLQKKPNAVERKNHLRDITRKVKNKLEAEWQKEGMNACLQERVSYSTWKRQREHQGFKAPSEKCQRLPKSHSPAMQSCDTAAVLEAVEKWPVGKVFNWTALARLM